MMTLDTLTLAKDLQTTISKKLFCHFNKGDKAAVLFSKQGQNNSQASFPSLLHFVQI